VYGPEIRNIPDCVILRGAGLLIADFLSSRNGEIFISDGLYTDPENPLFLTDPPDLSVSDRFEKLQEK
jgi:hypothetical protein